MKEAFYEESAVCIKSKREGMIYKIFHIASIVMFVLAGIWLSFSFTFILDNLSAGASGMALVIVLIEWFLFPLCSIAAGIALLFLKRHFNVSYDYTFVEDELRVTKVYNGKRRKYLTTLKAEQMLKIGWCDKDSFERTKQGAGKPKLLTSNKEPMEEKEFIYILYSSSIAKTLYVLECRQLLLEYIVRAAGRNKLERD